MTTRTTESFDALIIGTGQAGKPLARALGAAGFKTAIIEREHVGGSCINHGCTPTKTMVASGRVAYLARRAAEFGVRGCGTVQVEMGEVIARKRRVVEGFREGSRRGLESTPNVSLIFGEAAFDGERSVVVREPNGGTRGLRANRIFINTGTRAAIPAVQGIESVPKLDNVSILELEALPEHLLVLGGGYIGLEFGQMFRRYGSRVTVVHRGKRLLSREDADVADEVAKILRDDGLDMRLETTPVRVERDGDRGVRLTVQGRDGESVVAASHLLVATGRVPNSDRLNLAAAGVEMDRAGFIRVNERLETSAPGVWALGDVKGGPAFTHISYDDFRVVRANLLENRGATTNGRLVPYTVFIDPQLGRVGIGEDEARRAGRNIRVGILPMTHVARAIESGETRGFMKVVVGADTGKILGCAVLGMEGGEVMAMFQIAMMGGLPYTALKEGIFAHPTLAEALNNLFGAMDA